MDTAKGYQALTPEDRAKADDIAVDMLIQNITAEVNDLDPTTLDVYRLDKLAAAGHRLLEVLAIAARLMAEDVASDDYHQMIEGVTPPHDHQDHPQADGADGRDAHAS